MHYLESSVIPGVDRTHFVTETLKYIIETKYNPQKYGLKFQNLTTENKEILASTFSRNGLST